MNEELGPIDDLIYGNAPTEPIGDHGHVGGLGVRSSCPNREVHDERRDLWLGRSVCSSNRTRNTRRPDLGAGRLDFTAYRCFHSGWIVKGYVDRTDRPFLALHRSNRSRAFHCVFGIDSTSGKGRNALTNENG